MDDPLHQEARRAAVALYRRFGRDAAVIALHNRQRARAQHAAADVAAWQRIYRAVLDLEEHAADSEWRAGGDQRRTFTRVLARRLAARNRSSDAPFSRR
jgi:hypothetical protein